MAFIIVCVVSDIRFPLAGVCMLFVINDIDATLSLSPLPSSLPYVLLCRFKRVDTEDDGMATYYQNRELSNGRLAMVCVRLGGWMVANEQ